MGLEIYSRRDLVLLPARTVGLVALASSLGILVPPSVAVARGAFPIETRDSQSQDPLAELAQFSEQIGDRPLKVEEVRDFVIPSAAAVYSRRAALTGEQINERTFIVGTPSSEESAFRQKSQTHESIVQNSPTLRDLRKYYPGFNPGVDTTDDFADALSMNATEGRIFGVQEEGRAYIFLERNNTPFYNRVSTRVALQFDSSLQARCELAIPVVGLVSTGFHEWRHLESELLYNEQINKLKLIGIYADIVKERGSSFSFDYDEKNIGFRLFPFKDVKGSKGEHRSEGFNSLDEYVIEYLAIKDSLDNNLKAHASLSGPIDTKNFETVLKAAGISDSRLRDLHRTGNLPEFILKIAEAAQPAIFKSEDDALRFGFNLLYKAFKEEKIWEKAFSRYFPMLDVKHYDFTEKPEYLDRRYGYALGCGLTTYPYFT